MKQDYSNRTPFHLRIIRFFQFALAAIFKGLSLGGHVVLATSTPLTIAIPGVLVAKFRKIPLVFEVRDLWPEVPIAVGALKGRVPILAARALERWAYRNSQQVVALSDGMAQGIEATGYPGSQVTVIPNSCDNHLFDVPAEDGFRFRESLSWLGDRPLVLYPGTMGRINGVGYLVRVAQEMQAIDPEIRFLVIGDGVEREKVLELADKVGVAGRSFFHIPPLAKNDLPGYFSAADIVLSLVIPVPILETNSANKFFDGLAAGRPVGVNHGGWQAEIINRNKAGVVLDPADCSLAAKTLSEFLRDPERVSQARKAARVLATGSFSRDRLAAKLEKVLLGACGGPVDSTDYDDFQGPGNKPGPGL